MYDRACLGPAALSTCLPAPPISHHLPPPPTPPTPQDALSSATNRTTSSREVGGATFYDYDIESPVSAAAAGAGASAAEPVPVPPSQYDKGGGTSDSGHVSPPSQSGTQGVGQSVGSETALHSTGCICTCTCACASVPRLHLHLRVPFLDICSHLHPPH